MKVLTLAALCLAALGCASIPEHHTGGPRKLIADHPADVEGVWKSRGYGWILQISEGSVTRYETGAFGCYPTPDEARGKTAMLSAPFAAFRRAAGNSIRFMPIPDSQGTLFDRLTELPTGCDRPLPGDPETSLRVALSLFDEHYAHFERRNVWWSGLRQEAEEIFAAGGGDETALAAALDHILLALSDSHVKVFATVGGEPQRIQHGLGVTLPRIRERNGETAWLIGLIDQLRNYVLDPGAIHTAHERILWGTIEGRIGYLQVFVMGGFTDRSIGDPDWGEAELAALDGVLDEAFAAFEGLEAVILDLSNNRGGYDAVARALPGRFTDQPFVAYTVEGRGSDDPQPKMIRPADGPRFKGPVLMLTSDVTVSGGEIATMSARLLPNVIHVGQSTRGAFSTPLSKPLPNGWIIEIANETFRDARGSVFSGTGVPPEIVFEVFEAGDEVASHRRAIKRAIAVHDQGLMGQ